VSDPGTEETTDVTETVVEASTDEHETQATVSVESAVSSEVVPSEEATEPDSQAELPADGDVTSHTISDEAFSADGAGDGDEDDDEDEDDESSLLFLSGDWYVVHTYAGYENKVKANLASRIQSMNMEDKIYDVVVPTEEVMELKSGKMQAVQKKVFPGYILVRMELDDDSWYVVRNTPGVTGFVGSGAKPTPLDFIEVERILQPKTEDRPKPKLEYEIGEVVSVVGGAFSGYSGPVNAIDVDKQRVTVLLDLFGRETPVELTFDQVTKL
jgi:transcriptional antiterminator NusG